MDHWNSGTPDFGGTNIVMNPPSGQEPSGVWLGGDVEGPQTGARGGGVLNKHHDTVTSSETQQPISINSVDRSVSSIRDAAETHLPGGLRLDCGDDPEATKAAETLLDPHDVVLDRHQEKGMSSRGCRTDEAVEHFQIRQDQSR